MNPKLIFHLHVNKKITDEDGRLFLSGALTDDQNRYLSALSGWGKCEFDTISKRKRGRPPSEQLSERNMAAVLCFEWIIFTQGNHKNKADERAADLVAFSDRTIKRARKRAKKLLPASGTFLAIEGEGQLSGACIFMDRAESITITETSISVDGLGWFWRNGDKKAMYGKITGDGDFTPACIV